MFNLRRRGLASGKLPAKNKGTGQYKAGDWRHNVAAAAKQKRADLLALRKSSGVAKGKKPASMTFRKLFGVAQSEFSAYFRGTQEYTQWKKAYEDVPVGSRGQDAKNRARALVEAVESAKKKFRASGRGDPRKHYNSAKSIKILMHANGITSVSKAAINMIKMLDGRSAGALISWHKQKYGERPNIPDSEVMAFLKDQVVPHIQGSVQREETLQRRVALAGFQGSAGSIQTQPAPAHWKIEPRPPTFKPKSVSRNDYVPVRGPDYGTVVYKYQDPYQDKRNKGNKGKGEMRTFEVPVSDRDVIMKSTQREPPNYSSQKVYDEYGNEIIIEEADQRASKRRAGSVF